jgi:hypothetical protein
MKNNSDLTEYFPDYDSVNEAVGGLTATVKRPKRPNESLKRDAAKNRRTA